MAGGPRNRRIGPPASQRGEPPPESVRGKGQPKSTAPASKQKSAKSAEPKPRPKRKPVNWSTWKTRGRKFLVGLRGFVGVLTFLGVVATSSWGLYHYVSTSARFAIRDIRVTGAVHLNPKQIAAAGEVKRGENIFKLDPAVAQQKMAHDPWIQSAKVRRKLPDGIEIEVVEREAAALVVLGKTLYLAEENGEVFKRLEKGDPHDFPIISGVANHQAIIGDKAGVVSMVKRARAVATLYRQYAPYRSFALQEIHMSDDGSVQLIVGSEGVMLSLGKAPYRRKIARAGKVLMAIKRKKGKPSIIFADNEAHPERIVARMR